MKTAIATRKELGVYYTPGFVVDFIVGQTLGKLLEGKSPGEVRGIRILDPACGEGAFLLGAYRYLLDWHLKWHREHDLPGLVALSIAEKERILRANIFGVDIDARAAWVCGAALGKMAGDAADCGGNVRSGNSLTEPMSGEFDVVIGNPPYVRIQNIGQEEADYYRSKFSAATGRYDLYVLFVERGLQLLGPNGRLGFIVPNKFLTADYGRGLRGLIARERAMAGLLDLGEAQVFGEARTYTCLLFLKKGSDGFFWGEIPKDEKTEEYLGGFGPEIGVRNKALSDGPWAGFGGAEGKLLDRLLSDEFVRLGDVAERIFQGFISGADRLLYLPIEEARRREIEPGILRPVLKGSEVRRYRLMPAANLAVFPYEIRDGATRLIPELRLRDEYPRAYRYLVEVKRDLENRGSASMKYESWYAYWCARDRMAMEKPKILTQVLARGNKFAFDSEGRNSFVGGGNAGVYGIILNPEGMRLKVPFLLGVLNSRAARFVIERISSRFRGGYFSYARRFIQRLPVGRDGMDGGDCLGRLVQRREQADEGEIEEIERRIDRLVFEMFGLSRVEIEIIQAETGP